MCVEEVWECGQQLHGGDAASFGITIQGQFKSGNTQQCKPGLSLPLYGALTAVCGISKRKWNLSKLKLVT